MRVEVGGTTIPQRESAPQSQMLALFDDERITHVAADTRPIYNGASSVSEMAREMVFVKPGVLVLYLGTAPASGAQAEQALLREVQKIRDVPVSAEELARAKGYLLGRYAMDRRTNERLAWYLAFYEVEGVGRAYPERFRRAVEAVTIADVQRVARIYLATPTTVVLGPSGGR